MMNEKLRTTISIILITAMLIPVVGAAYILKNDGTITLSHGDLYIDGVTVDNYVNSLLVAFSGFDQSLNTTDDVEFQGVTTGWMSLDGVNRTTWPATAPVSGNSTYLGDTFLVIYDGVNYQGVYYNGTVLFTNASPYTTIQNCINYVTADAAGATNYLDNRVLPRGSVRLGPGTFALGNNYLKIPNHFTLSGSGPGSTIITTTHTTTAIAPMWSNYTYDVTLQDLSIWGASGTTDYPLKWYMTESTLPSGETYSWWLKINDVAIRTYQTGPALFQTTTGSSQTIMQINNFRVTGKLYFNRISEAIMDNFFCYGLNLDSVSTSHFSNGYVGGSNNPNIYLYGDSEAYPNDGNIFTNIRSDNPSGEAFRLSGYSQKNQIVACQFSNSNNGASAAALRFGPTTKENLVTGCSFVNYPRQTPDFFTYLVWFEAGSEDNVLLGNYYQADAFVILSILDSGDNLVETLPTPP